MSEQIITKQCSKCKEIKPLLAFHKDPTKKSSYRSNCKICYLKYCKKYRQTEKYKAARKHYHQSKKGKATRVKCKQRHDIQYPDHYKARYTVLNAIKIGKLPRPDTLPCHYCEQKAEQYHHYKGYAQEHRLDVIPVCRKCHKKLDSRDIKLSKQRIGINDTLNIFEGVSS